MDMLASTIGHARLSRPETDEIALHGMEERLSSILLHLTMHDSSTQSCISSSRVSSFFLLLDGTRPPVNNQKLEP